MNKLRPRLPLLAAALATGGVIACGSLGDSGASRQLANIHGALTGDVVKTQSAALHAAGAAAGTGPIRVAVVWRNANSNGFNASADAPVTAGATPFEFNISLTGAPPVDVLITRSILASQYGAYGSYSSSSGSSYDDPGLPGSPPHFASFEPQDLSADFAFAMGTLVAYRDNNGNGKLDLVDSSATTFVDEVVGINESLGVFWFQGTIPNGGDLRDLAGTLPNAGYDLALLSPCPRGPLVDDSTATATGKDWGSSGTSTSTSSGGSSGGSSMRSAKLSLLMATPFDGNSTTSCSRPKAWLPPTASVEIAFASNPQFASYMCNRISGSSEETASAGVSSGGSSGSGGIGPRPGWSSSYGNPPAGYPAHGASNLSCYDAGRSYRYSGCDTVTDGAGLCQHPRLSCWGKDEALADFAPTPTGWPCTVTSDVAPGSTFLDASVGTSSSGSSGASDGGGPPH